MLERVYRYLGSNDELPSLPADDEEQLAHVMFHLSSADTLEKQCEMAERFAKSYSSSNTQLAKILNNFYVWRSVMLVHEFPLLRKAKVFRLRTLAKDAMKEVFGVSVLPFRG